jgi:glycosyltransferase involved in cell wall biosynthesis
MGKKIAFLIFSDGWGGLELNVLRLRRWMTQRGWDITMIVREGTPLEAALEAESANRIILPKHKKIFDILGARRLAGLLKDKNLNLLFAFDNADLDLVFLTKTLFHKQLKLVYQQQMQIGINKRDLLHTLRYRALNRWITPLKGLQREIGLRTRYPLERTRVIPLNAEVEAYTTRKYSKEAARAAWQIPTQRATLGIMGRLDAKKGQLFAAQGLARLLQKGHDVQLLIVGRMTLNDPTAADYLKRIQDFVAQNKLEERVFLRGHTDETLSFYNAIDLFVMASQGETFGMVTVEAMLAGVPVLGTNSSGTPELLEQGSLGTLFEYENLDDFVGKAGAMLEDPAAFEQVAKQAQERAKIKYSHTAQCQAFEAVIAELFPV